VTTDLGHPGSVGQARDMGPGIKRPTIRVRHGYGSIFIEMDRNTGQNRVMDKRLVISKLREHRDELTAAGIIHLRLFGSVARGEANDSPMST
jgi:hypothetical protein